MNSASNSSDKTHAYVFTAESVSEGHPDKLADRISDAILDRFLSGDPDAKVACESLRSTGSRRRDQSEVWADISEKAARMDAFSATDAAAALYETHRARLDEYLHAFLATDNQSGALFAINDEVVGLDLFDSPATLVRLLPKLVQSYALDTVDAGDGESRPGEQAPRS